MKRERFRSSKPWAVQTPTAKLTTSTNAAQTVQEKMEIEEDSSTHGEVSAREVACYTGIPCTFVWVALRCTLLCYLYKIQRHDERLPGEIL